MSKFHGKRTPNGCVVTFDGRPLDPCLYIRNHSPDGFNWGYGGSGPAQLALAMIVRVSCTRVAQTLYQEFKAGVIARITVDEWEVPAQAISWWVNERLMGLPEEKKQRLLKALGKKR